MSNMTISRNQSYVQQQQHQSAYEKMASGKKINKAADGAAQLAIAEKIIKEYNSLDVGTRNMSTGQDMLNVADSALGGVSDYLGRMNELAIQASNDTLTDSDRENIQKEIDQLKEGISSIADQTTFNGRKLLDGSNMQGLQIASDGHGSVRVKQSVDATLDSLGIKDFDVTKKDFDLESVSNALQKVNDSRSQIGAQTNRLQHGIDNNNVNSVNQKSAESRLMDTEYGAASTNLKKQQTLRDYSLQMQRNQLQYNARMTQNFMVS